MSSRLAIALVVWALWSRSALADEPADRTRTFSLASCLATALERHPELAALKIRIEAERQAARAEYLPFEPRLDLRTTLRADRTPLVGPALSFLQPDADIDVRRWTAEVTAASLFPSGTELSLAFTHDLLTSSAVTEALNPRLGVGLELTVSQQLLRASSSAVNLLPVRAQELRAEEATGALRAREDEILRDIGQRYLVLARAGELLTVRKQALELASRFQELTEATIAGGNLSRLDRALAVEVVAERRVDVTQAEADLRRASFDLLNALRVRSPDELGADLILGAPAGDWPPPDEGVERSIERARQRSGRRAQLERQIDRLKTEIEIAEDANKSALRVFLSARLDTLSGSNACPEGVLPDGITPCFVPDEYEGTYDRAAVQLLTGRFFGIGVGIAGELPLDFHGARDARIAATARRISAIERDLENEDLAIAGLVQRLAREILDGRQVLRSTREVLALSDEALEAENTKFKNGRSTGFDVLNAQTIRLNVRIREVETRYALTRALLELRSLVGELTPDRASLFPSQGQN
jgi:outer membrane protein TolC